MKRLLFILLLLLAPSAIGQAPPLLRTTFTTNAASGYSVSTTNLSTPGDLLLNGRTNHLSISPTNTLLLDGVPVVTSAVSIPSAIFFGGQNNNVQSNTGKGSTFSGNGGSAWTTAIESTLSAPMCRSGTISNFVAKYVVNATALPLGSGTNATIILYTNHVPSPFIFTIVPDGVMTVTNSGTLSCFILANTALSWRVTNNIASTVAIDLLWSVEFY